MRVLQRELMKNHTTLGIGGPAREFIIIKTGEELVEAIKRARKMELPYIVIGSGSNLLVSDDGFDGVIINNNISGISSEDNQIKVAAGTTLQSFVDYTIVNGLDGMSTMTGIPGTVGGAIYGNAAAYGQAVSDYLEKVYVFDGKNELWLTKEECLFDYRDSGFKKTINIIIEAVFNFPKGDPEKLKLESEETLKKRLVKYPPGIKTPGSFFKNVLASNLSKETLAKIPVDKIIFGKIPAGYLLEAVGAKGDQLGQIKIADNHGNTFMNLGGGNASDFYALAKKYYQKVKERFGIELEPEVQFINLPPLNAD